jgi:hypothetical protein
VTVADLVSDGKIRVYFVTTIANINAPTTTELNAGLRLDQNMTADGLDRSFDTADVDLSALSSTFDTKGVGRRTPTVGITLKRQTGSDTLAAALVYQAVGYIVVRDNIDASTAWATGQSCEVFPVACKQGSKAYGPNTVQRLAVPMTVTSDPALAAVVA